MINNFDQSSTGINIKAIVLYDQSLAQDQFKDNFERLKDNHFYYIDYGNVENIHEWTIYGSKSEMEKFMKENCNLIDIKGMTSSQLNNEILEYFAMSYSFSPENIKDINKELESYDLEFNAKQKIKSVFIRGYSQGDFATVYYSPEQLKQVWGNEPNEEDLKEEFTSLFFDCPIYARVTINEKEFIYELDSYEWQKDKFIEVITKEYNSEYVKQWLKDNLPETPEY